MKAVILERYVMHEGDLDWSGVKALIRSEEHTSELQSH